jgi:hypothetical protein
MVLVKSSEHNPPAPTRKEQDEAMTSAALVELDADPNPDLTEFQPGVLTHSIGQLTKGRQKHYYSDGNFNLIRLIFHLLKQTGPAHVFMTTYSISQQSLEKVQNALNRGDLLSIRFLIDNRVKVMSPIPFQRLKASFNYRCVSLHAKVALIENDDWRISIVTSQNATDNPKLERGIIFTDDRIFNFDKTHLENVFKRGTD